MADDQKNHELAFAHAHGEDPFSFGMFSSRPCTSCRANAEDPSPMAAIRWGDVSLTDDIIQVFANHVCNVEPCLTNETEKTQRTRASESSANDMATGLADGRWAGLRSRCDWFRVTLVAMNANNPGRIMAECFGGTDPESEEQSDEQSGDEATIVERLGALTNALDALIIAGHIMIGGHADDDFDGTTEQTTSSTSAATSAEEDGYGSDGYVVIEEAVSTGNIGHQDGEEQGSDDDFIIL